jgi:hypothetical protein
VARMGEEGNEYTFLVGKPEGKSLLGKPRRRWENSIKTGSECVGWIRLALVRDRWRTVLDTLMNLRVLSRRS